MKPIQQDFTVRYSFPVLFSRDVFNPANLLLPDFLCRTGTKRHLILVFIDSGVVDNFPEFSLQVERFAGVHSHIIDLAAPPVIIAGGEQCKNNTATLELVQALIGKNHLCRQSFVLAIGGGALLDVVGYGAATAHRGVRLIRMPTTVLAQNDAGVGVKNGINGLGRKNFLGTFAPPAAVINDFDFLNTLPDRDLRAGVVEAIKVALIKDADFFHSLCSERHRLAAFNQDAMEQMIYRCAALHIDHIGTKGDPFETGSSRPLDFGHWSAHKLEELTGNEINHGEAVAIGIALDSYYALQCGMLSRTELDSILTLLEDLHLQLFHPALCKMDIGEALRDFQEHLGGDLTITLPKGIGNTVEVHDINIVLMQHCITMLTERWQKHHHRWKNRGTRSAPRRLILKTTGSKQTIAAPVVIGLGSR